MVPPERMDEVLTFDFELGDFGKRLPRQIDFGVLRNASRIFRNHEAARLLYGA
jgi:hypothetical protein